MVIMDGKAVSQKQNQALKKLIRTATLKYQRPPGLAVILVGDDLASHIYVNSKIKIAEELGIFTKDLFFDANIKEEKLIKTIEKLNKDPQIDGILVQLPLPKHLDTPKILDLVNPDKDVDGFSVIQQGKLFQARDSIVSATPRGIIDLIDYYQIDVLGMNACVIGKSLIVGLPVAKLLLDRHATVTTCHSQTKDLKKHTKEADLIVVAVGKPNLITSEMVKPGAIIIDVGINRLENKIVGDVDFENVKGKASYITPVPGGVGPMTISALMENLYEIYLKAQK